MTILQSHWEAVGSIVRTCYNEQDGGHLFVCDCFKRRDGQIGYNMINAHEVAEAIARAHNEGLDNQKDK